MKPHIKICGLTRPEDSRLAVDLGASHVGCAMAPGSPRSVTAACAKEVFEAAGEAIGVLVFKNRPVDFVVDQARKVGTHHVQLYGYSEQNCLFLENSELMVYRVFRMDIESDSLPPMIPSPTEITPAVLDVGGGGSGQYFSWDLLGRQAPNATFIAGGISPGNISLLMKHKPYGVDLSSGIESRPGIKSPSLLKSFFANLEDSL